METRQPFVSEPLPHALGIDFNGYGKFTVATDKGFRVHNARDGKLLIERDFGGSLSFAATLDNSNIVGLIGGGENPKLSPNKVLREDLLQTYRH